MGAQRERSDKAESPKRLRVAVCIDTRDGPGRQRLLGVYRYALPRHWNLLLVRGDDAAAVRQVAEMHVDGAILFDRARWFHQQLRRLGLRCVETSARNLECDDAAVFVDDDAVAEVAVQHLVQAGFEHFGYCGPSGTQVPAARRGARFCESVKRLGFSVDAFAAIGVPRRTLERRFVAALGRTIHDFIVDVRLRHAKRLLRRSDGSLGDVARQCGYSAPSAFTRMFEARVGCRPEAYRRKVRSAD